MKTRLLTVLCLLCLSFSVLRAQTQTLGILGDSNSDEYRAEDQRGAGSGYEATTLSWDELLVAHRGVDIGAWGNWNNTTPSVRRTGYANNWSQSGLDSCGMESDQEPQGAAAQHLDYVVIYIGANDYNIWNGSYAAVYDGSIAGGALTAKEDSIVTCIQNAVNTLQAAWPTKIVLTNIADPSNSPSFISAFPVASQRAAVTQSINRINIRLANVATSHGIVLADLAQFAVSVFSQVNGSGQLIVGGVTIDMVNTGYEPHHFIMSDSHLGTVGNGLFANWIGSQLATVGFSYTPFSDAEILANAVIGMTLPTNTPHPTATSTPLPTLTNTPSPTNTATYTMVFTATPSNTPTNTATVTVTRIPTTVPVKTIRIITHTNGAQVYSVIDGITENGVFTEINVPGRFVFMGWIFSPNQGRNNSPFEYTTSANKTVQFSTSANTLVIQTVKYAYAGSFDVYVNDVFKLTYNGYVAQSVPAPVTYDLNVPLG